jgi:hypothetical protein
MRRTFKKKLALSRETLHEVAGGITVVSHRCFSGKATFCGTCPKVTADWPSCDATFCECLTDVKCDAA